MVEMIFCRRGSELYGMFQSNSSKGSVNLIIYWVSYVKGVDIQCLSASVRYLTAGIALTTRQIANGYFKLNLANLFLVEFSPKETFLATN